MTPCCLRFSLDFRECSWTSHSLYLCALREALRPQSVWEGIGSKKEEEEAERKESNEKKEEEEKVDENGMAE